MYTTKRLTARQFYSYHLHTQPGKSDAIFRTCRLFQEYLVVSFAKIENNRLYFIQTNQSKLRAELYNNLCDAMHRHDAQNSTDPLVVGRPVILPSSFAGSPRDMHRRFQDQMAIVRRLGKPDLFVTFTCNPNWPEITEALLPGQQAKDRPDIISRVFKNKLKSLMADLVKDDIFGKCVAHVYVIEFQKRGLPHAHILIWLSHSCKIKTADDVDSIISAELPPDPETFHILTLTFLSIWCTSRKIKNGKHVKKMSVLLVEFLQCIQLLVKCFICRFFCIMNRVKALSHLTIFELSIVVFCQHFKQLAVPLVFFKTTANGIRHCKKQNTRSFVVKFVSSLLQCCCFVTLATRLNCLIAIISTGGTITRGKWNGQTDLKIKREVINFF